VAVVLAFEFLIFDRQFCFVRLGFAAVTVFSGVGAHLQVLVLRRSATRRRALYLGKDAAAREIPAVFAAACSKLPMAPQQKEASAFGPGFVLSSDL
jgi:hypothetical protein